jgi:biotin carboxyl carrier protein
MNRASRWTIALCLTLAVSACGTNEAEREAQTLRQASPQRVQPDGTLRLTDQDRTALGLTVIAASESPLPDTTLRFGRVVSPPSDEADVVSPVTGRIAGPPLVSLGTIVPQGATIVEITPVLDAPDRIAVGTQTAQRDGEIAAGEQEVAKADAAAARARALSPQIVSAATLQEADTAAATARARLDALRRARAVSSDLQTQAVAVHAPMAGTLVTVGMTVGTIVRSGEVLAAILRPGPRWIDVSVSPDEPTGDRYEVVTSASTVPAHLLARGRITETDGSRHDRLLVAPAQAGDLVPGAAVSVHVGRGASRGIVLPESAVVAGIESDTVFVETSPGIFVARPVRIDARFGGLVRLASGVTPGEHVVTQGAMALQGERVRAQLRPSG